MRSHPPWKLQPEYLPYVTVKPPPFADSGVGKWFGWLKAVFIVSDAFVLRSAGLDALVLQKAHAVGVQMMLPMAIIGCCLLLPLQISQAYIAGDTSYGRVTMANIAPSSSIMWAHWCACFLFLGWTFMLLEYHTRQYAAVRQHYLRGGDDPNYWRDLHMAEADGTHVHKGAKLLDVLGAAKFGGMLEAEEELLEAQVKQRHWYQRLLRGLTSWTGQESVERAARLAGNKEVKIDLAHDVIQGDFLRDAATEQQYLAVRMQPACQLQLCLARE
ncbi:late exocytosis, associated with Golgi transport-domain-containing protein [Scenedesmus sp. NREL 46B-D3]|nr:late exocytosis, associated with Golgi transport-domain-containing protein [Scenedesmus sp. NREL 46B-D3]